LARIAENGASESARVRALELVGKELGMFVERPAVPWDGDLTKLTTEQLERVTEQLIEQSYEGQPEVIAAVKREMLGPGRSKVIDGQFERVSDAPR
jgi:hypothetical protein